MFAETMPLLLVLFAPPNQGWGGLIMFLAGEAGEGFSLQSSLELAGLEMSEEASSCLTG